MTAARWFTACLADWRDSSGRSPEYAAIQLQELREVAALIIAGADHE